MRNSEEIDRAIAGRPITSEELLEMIQTNLTYDDGAVVGAEIVLPGN